MRPSISVSTAFLVVATLSGCATIKAPENKPLKDGEVRDIIYEIPTTQKPVPVNIQFKMSHVGDKRGIEVSIKNHPWGGVGMTMPRTIGDKAPDYEYIPCEDGPELKAKWDELAQYADFAYKGRDIQDIHYVYIDMRFRQDYALRRYVLDSAKNLCSVALK